jgi:hypothetical protein
MQRPQAPSQAAYLVPQLCGPELLRLPLSHCKLLPQLADLGRAGGGPRIPLGLLSLLSLAKLLCLLCLLHLESQLVAAAFLLCQQRPQRADRKSTHSTSLPDQISRKLAEALALARGAGFEATWKRRCGEAQSDSKHDIHMQAGLSEPGLGPAKTRRARPADAHVAAASAATSHTAPKTPDC